MDVIAIVVTYNRRVLLKECINAILKQTFRCDKILIIDNNSTDGTKEMLIQENLLQKDIIDYRKLEVNIGGAGGFSKGIRIAIDFNPKFIWIMDDDTIPLENSLEELIMSQSYVKDEFSFLASTVFGTDGEPMNVPQISMRTHENGYQDWYRLLGESMVEISIATFVSLLINAKAVKKVGLPCQNYFIWGDDTEYTMRLTTYYGRAYLCGKSKVVHKRKGAANISLVEEKNPGRYHLYYYSYRNNLINTFEYQGKGKGVLLFIHNLKDALKIILLSRDKLKKVSIIIKSNMDFLFGRYNRNSFKKRFEL